MLPCCFVLRWHGDEYEVRDYEVRDYGWRVVAQNLDAKTAKLIAAAPELFRLLKRIINDAAWSNEGGIGAYTCGPYADTPDSCIVLAQKLLATLDPNEGGHK